VNKTQQLIALHQAQPEAYARPVKELAEQFDCNPTLVSKARTRARKAGSEKTSTATTRRRKSTGRPAEATTNRIDVQLHQPLEVVVHDGEEQTLRGTLVLSPTGLKYIRPRAKVRQQHEIPWTKLDTVMAFFNE